MERTLLVSRRARGEEVGVSWLNLKLEGGMQAQGIQGLGRGAAS